LIALPAVIVIGEAPRGHRPFDISPAERRIAYSTAHTTNDVWVLDLKAALK
jgi:hypothetical protein